MRRFPPIAGSCRFPPMQIPSDRGVMQIPSDRGVMQIPSDADSLRSRGHADSHPWPDRTFCGLRLAICRDLPRSPATSASRLAASERTSDSFRVLPKSFLLPSGDALRFLPSQLPEAPEVNMRSKAGPMRPAFLQRHRKAMAEGVPWWSGALLPPGVAFTNGSWGPRAYW